MTAATTTSDRRPLSAAVRLPVAHLASAPLLAAFAVLFAIPAAGDTTPGRFLVNSTRDVVDVQPGDGICGTSTGACTLRAAVMEANATDGVNAIVLPAGRFPLRLPQVSSPVPQAALLVGGDASGGDLDLLHPVLIQGAGAHRTTIDGLHRTGLFNVGLGVGGVGAVFADLTLANGQQGELLGGGAIYGTGRMTLRRVNAVNNASSGAGGAVFAAFNGGVNPPIEIYDSTFSSNSAHSGGAVRFDDGGLVVNSTFSGNQLTADCDTGLQYDGAPTCEGGALHVLGKAPFSLIHSTVVGNHAVTGGGGLSFAWDYIPGTPVDAAAANSAVFQPARVRGSIIADNTSTAGTADCKITERTLISLGANLSSDSSCEFVARTDKIQTRPRLGALTWTLGQTPVRPPLPGSPAIDAAGPSCPASDQRGLARPQGQTCDIGAVEVKRN